MNQLRCKVKFCWGTLPNALVFLDVLFATFHFTSCVSIKHRNEKGPLKRKGKESAIALPSGNTYYIAQSLI